MIRAQDIQAKKTGEQPGYAPHAFRKVFFMQMYDIIRKKRDGKALSREELAYFISGYVKEEIPDYQASALLMAICFNGMTDEEISDLTELMMHSGDTVDLSVFGDLTADKHSTGGVGDKTSLAVAPIVAALGCKVAKMSGRGLGHTGGTVDKLEAIPGFNTALSAEEFIAQVEKVGVAVIGQTGDLVPADKKLYALRDVTATIDSIPLITSSIMSKKLAAGSHTIVLDVKTGSGAFMKKPEDACVLAEKMVEIGKRCGRKTAALITDMDAPLGENIGNSLEVIEAVGVLKGEVKSELRDVCASLAAEMVSLVKGISPEQALADVNECIDSGAAYAKMKEWIAAQGGNAAYLDNVSLFPAANYSLQVSAPVSGFITHTDAELIGKASVVLGAGRKEKGDPIDFAAGIILHKKTCDRAEEGEALCTLYTNIESTLTQAEQMILDAYSFGDAAPQKIPHVYKIIR